MYILRTIRPAVLFWYSMGQHAFFSQSAALGSTWSVNVFYKLKSAVRPRVHAFYYQEICYLLLQTLLFILKGLGRWGSSSDEISCFNSKVELFLKSKFAHAGLLSFILSFLLAFNALSLIFCADQKSLIIYYCF